MMQIIKKIIHDLSDTTNALRSRVVKASSWNLLYYAFDLIISLLQSIIFTRLLFPEAYGLIAVATIMPTVLIMWSDVGIRSSILRNQAGNTAEFLGTAWVIQSIRGFGIWILIVLFSQLFRELQIKAIFPVQSVFNNPQVPLLMSVVGISSFLNGLESTKIHLAYRELQLRYVTILDICVRLFTFAVMIVMCFISRSVWVLAIGLLSGDFLKMILSHLILKGPSFRFIWNKKYASDIFEQGKWIALSSFFSLITLQGDRILLGLFFPASVLGFYSIATRLISAFKSILDFNIAHIVPTIFGETFRNFPEAMKERYYKIRLPINFIAFFFVGFLLIAAPSIVSFLYDPRYSNAGWMLQWLSLWLLALPFETIQHAFPVVGKSQIYALMSMVQAGFLIFLSLAGYYFFDLTGMIAGISCYRLFSSLVLIILARQMGWISLRQELSGMKMLFFGFMTGFIISLALKGIK